MVLISEWTGFKIYGREHPAKKNGRDLVWIEINQEKPKKWRINSLLGYTRSPRISFVKE